MSHAAHPVAAVRLEIDGRPVCASHGRTVLEAAREAGIEIPALCHHPAVEPVGACRLCMVEVTHASWGGHRSLVTACLYPVSDGLAVATDSERVRESRRHTLSLLAARCPESEVIGKLAAEYGASTGQLRLTAGGDKCILCGLCARVCEAHATAALTTFGRGAGKAVGAFAAGVPEECVGCGACATLCPTGNIAAARKGARYEIQQRRFEAAGCTVDRVKCIGCGACEQACPFDVARVVLEVGGRLRARIETEHCRGCGACVGACPVGSIDQPAADWASLRAGDGSAKGSVVVFACKRAGLTETALGPDFVLRELACVGRVTVGLLLAALAHGARAVVVLGRHPQTCRLGGAERVAEQHTRQAALAAELVGVDPGRVRFALAGPGPKGALRTVAELGPSIRSLAAGRIPIAASVAAPTVPARDGLDAAIALLGWLGDRPPEAACGARWRQSRDCPAGPATGTLLYAGAAPLFDAIAPSLWRPVRLDGVLATALALLRRCEPAEVSLAVGPLAATAHEARAVFALSPEDERTLAAAGLRARSLSDWVRERAGALGWAAAGGARVGCDGSREAIALLTALGHEPVDLGPDRLPDRFDLSPAERAAADERLRRGETGGAVTLLVPSVASLARWALLCREGSWRSSRLAPVMAHELGWLACSHEALTRHALARLRGSPPAGARHAP